MEDYPPEKAKPDPYPIQRALEKISETDAVYVGDSVDDIVAAKRAGLRAFGCIPPNMDAKRLSGLLTKVGAEHILSKVELIGEHLQ
jgi:HAD superfamily phosphatase